MSDRWFSGRPPRGRDYDARFEQLAASGVDVHGEADLVWSLLGTDGGTVLDAGCGTGRVAVELARRGAEVVGVDIDPLMLDSARAKAPGLTWVEASLGDVGLDLQRRFDVVVAAGNVLLFVDRGTEATVVANLGKHLVEGGRLVAGFQLGQPDRLTLEDYDRHCTAVGLVLADRWSTWGRDPWRPGGDYAVSVHRRDGRISR